MPWRYSQDWTGQTAWPLITTLLLLWSRVRRFVQYHDNNLLMGNHNVLDMPVSENNGLSSYICLLCRHSVETDCWKYNDFKTEFSKATSYNLPLVGSKLYQLTGLQGVSPAAAAVRPPGKRTSLQTWQLLQLMKTAQVSVQLQNSVCNNFLLMLVQCAIHIGDRLEQPFFRHCRNWQSPIHVSMQSHIHSLQWIILYCIVI